MARLRRKGGAALWRRVLRFGSPRARALVAVAAPRRMLGRLRRGRWLSLGAPAALALFSGWTSTAMASSGADKAVRYRGYRIVVPASWPVYDLRSRPSVCVRFDRHAVYLGSPSSAQRCPAHAVG